MLTAYRRHHSTETAVIDVLSDVYEAADSGQVTLLGMLDQSSAFDVVDHQILFNRLEHAFGLTGRVLDWIKSYLSSRSMYVFFNGNASSVTSVVCGIPQGSVLGPLFFLLYTAPLLPIIEEHGFKVHAYADDLQIYAHVSPKRSSDLVTRFSDCVEAVKSWMASNRLKLNPSKTEIIWLRSAGQLQRCPMTPLLIAGAWIMPSSRVRNLGVIIDGALTMGAHVDKLVGICFFHLRQLRIVRRTLDVDAAHALVRALIHSRLDYCNTVLAGLPAYMFKRLQSVLNAAARLVLQIPGRQSVSIPMAEKLHWLGFPHRVTYKLCVLIYKGLHGLAPDYLSRRCVRVCDVPGRAHLRSASAGQLMVPITNKRTIGDKVGDLQLLRLDSVLRAAARLILRKRRYDSISGDIRDQLHWLPVRQRIDYKLCVMVHNCLRGQAPSYLLEMLSTVASVPGLHGNRSAARGDLNIPRTKTVTFGPRSFEVAGPTLWNSLPVNIRNANSLPLFKNFLKTFLFIKAHGVWTVRAPPLRLCGKEGLYKLVLHYTFYKGFSHCGPVAWNNLPLHLRSDDCTPSLDCFKKHLKTALFKLTTQK